MYGSKAIYLLLSLHEYSSYNYTVIAKPEIAARFPTNPNANFINEADISHRMLLESSYSQVGSTFYGDSSNHMIGYNGVFISDNGLIIAFSSYNYDYVDVYEYNGSSWIRKGSRINSHVGDVDFGRSLDLSSDGLTVAVGGQTYSDGNANRGALFIYNFDGSGWVLHTSIYGDNVNQEVGVSFALSGDGATLLYSSTVYYEVSVMRLTSNVWSQIGSSIGAISTDPNDAFGYGLAINYDGSIIAVSADTYVQVYQYQTNQWVQQGSTISSSSTGAKFRIDLNDIGNLLVVNSSGGSLNAYQYVNNDWGSMYTDDDITVTDSSSSGFATKISNDGSLVFLGTTNNYFLAFAMTECGWYLVQEIYLNELYFGYYFDVTGDGTRLIVSAYGSNSNQGSVYVYDINPVLECPNPSSLPTDIPSYIPSFDPTSLPTFDPSEYPSDHPTLKPSVLPSNLPTFIPSESPTNIPSLQPSKYPSGTPSFVPTFVPTLIPSKNPTNIPSVEPSEYPSILPSFEPSFSPSLIPSENPTNIPSVEPSEYPSVFPSFKPSFSPSLIPSENPTNIPSVEPSEYPSVLPSFEPSFSPSLSPSENPTMVPSVQPSIYPSVLPSFKPSTLPSSLPSPIPSESPSVFPSVLSSNIPTQLPSISSSNIPTEIQSVSPSNKTTQLPSVTSSFDDTISSSIPSDMLSQLPTIILSQLPTKIPSASPSVIFASMNPSDVASDVPSTIPSMTPSVSPSLIPSFTPSFMLFSMSPSSFSSYPPSLSSTASFTNITLSQLGTASLQIDECLNRELDDTEVKEMERILFDFVQQTLYDQNIQILNITIDSQSQLRLLQQQGQELELEQKQDHDNDNDNDLNNRRNLQFVSRRFDIRSYALCEESIDFQSSFSRSFEDSASNIELLQTLKSSTIVGTFFENALLLKPASLVTDRFPSTSPSIIQASVTPVNDGTNAGTVGAAALAGVGAAAAAGSASASSAGAAASASVGGGGSGGGAGGGAGGERKIKSLSNDVSEASQDQHARKKSIEAEAALGDDGDVENNYNNSLDTENDEISSGHQDSKETTLFSQSQDTGTGVGEAAGVGSASAKSASVLSSASNDGDIGGGADRLNGVEKKDEHNTGKGVETVIERGEDDIVDKNNNNSLGNNTVEISSERHASKETTLSHQSQDTEAVSNQEKDNQTTNTGKDRLSKTGDALMIAEGGLEKKVGNLNAWKRVKRSLSKKEIHEIPANVVVAAYVLKAAIRLERRIET